MICCETVKSNAIYCGYFCYRWSFRWPAFSCRLWRACWFMLCCMAFGAASLILTRWRYAQIQMLSGYLKRINAGEAGLDVRDNAEGELSILKNEIYKVTVTLRSQNETLKRDKVTMQSALSNISHQIKTPLTSMFVMTDLLEDENLPDDKRREFTRRIHVQLERLQWLVAALLKLSRLDAGTVDFNREPVSAKELLDKAAAPVLVASELKEQDLSLLDNGITLCCDANWTAEALLNLLKNCVEHTPPGGSITAVCEENPLFYQIYVHDSGPGIDREDLPHIWERFYRGKNAANDSVGIGLAMSAAIVQGQGGRSVDAQTRSGGGALFTIRLPK